MTSTTTDHDWRQRTDLRFFWHFGLASEEQFVALCGITIAADIDVEIGARPAFEDRCDTCERERIERVRIERGLVELLAAPTHEDYSSAHQFDFGGES